MLAKHALYQLSYIPLPTNTMLTQLPYILPFFCILLAASVNLTGGRLFRPTTTKNLTILLFIGSLCSQTLLVTSCITENVSVEVTLLQWLHTREFTINLTLLYDRLSILMSWVVITISTIVHIYSYDYMKNDPHKTRFMFYLNIFTFFMLLLITAGNLIVLFFGWEGVGICSYLLVNFWYTRVQANKSALKAILVNRIGDIGILLAIALLYKATDVFTYSEIFKKIAELPITNPEISKTLELSAFFLLLGAIGKSAQFGLHTWLPDAMEGPTPVSALLHAATMVTAGVFLIIRFAPLINLFPNQQALCTIIGALTAVFAATTAAFQNDIKKIIAFSTCSHLGFMFVSCGLGQYHAAFFHLFNHAFFKALLFLSAGNVIHALNDEQDIRKMGGLYNKLPLTFTFFSIASLSAIGLPYLSGFYSKDLIIELAAINMTVNGTFIFFLTLLGTLFSAIYSFKLINHVFIQAPNYSPNFKTTGVHDAEPHILLILSVLAVLSVFSGYFFSEHFGSVGTNFLETQLATTTPGLLENECLPLGYRYLPPFCIIIGFLITTQLTKIAKYVISSQPDNRNQASIVNATSLYYYTFSFLNQKWFIDNIYNHVLIGGMRYCYRFYQFFDKGLLEIIGPTGAYNVLTKTSTAFTRTTQTGHIQYYIGIVFLVTVILTPLIYHVAIDLFYGMIDSIHYEKAIEIKDGVEHYDPRYAESLWSASYNPDLEQDNFLE